MTAPGPDVAAWLETDRRKAADALARVEALAAQLDTEAHARPDGWVLAGIARRIREALRG